MEATAAVAVVSTRVTHSTQATGQVYRSVTAAHAVVALAKEQPVTKFVRGASLSVSASGTRASQRADSKEEERCLRQLCTLVAETGTDGMPASLSCTLPGYTSVISLLCVLQSCI